MADCRSNYSNTLGQSGFTLVEVMVTIVIFSIGILGTTSMLTSSIKGNSTAGHITTIATQSQDMVETLLSLPYGNSLFDPGITPIPAADLPAGVSSGSLAVNLEAATGIKRIAMTWNYTLAGTPRNMVINFIKQEID